MGGLAAARRQRVPAGFSRHRSQSRARCDEPLPDGSRRPDMGNFFPQGGQSWSGWFGLGPNTFPLGSRVAAVSTQPGGTSLFVVGLDEGHGGGRVWTNSFPDPRHPNQGMGWRPLGDNVFRPGSPVTALSLAPGATSLYLMGLDGQIWGNFFPQGGQSWSGWFWPGPQHFPARFAGGGGEHPTRWRKPFRGRARRRAWRRPGLDKLIS